MKLITEQGYTYPKAAERLGVPFHSLKNWVKKMRAEGKAPPVSAPLPEAEELKRLLKENQRLLSGVRLSGPMAPFIFDGALDGKVFRTWVEKILLPELDIGDIVIADNLSSHKTVAAHEMLEKAGCRLVFLPPYSPDYNPIENMWSKACVPSLNEDWKDCIRP